MAAKETNRLAASFANCSIYRSRVSDGFGGNLVGTLSSIHAWADVCVWAAGTLDRCYSRGVVLFGQIILADEANVHLPAVDDSDEQSVVLHLAGRWHRFVRSHLFRKALRRAKCRGRGGIFCGDVEPGARIHHALHVSVHVRGRPLPIFGLHRPDRAGLHWFSEADCLSAVWSAFARRARDFG